ncbi:MAG: SAF domain-containing protein [Alkaliphilus sp.]
MKKINRRLAIIVVFSFVVASVLTYFIYTEMRNIAQPEETRDALVFTRRIEVGDTISNRDITKKSFPVSLIAEGTVVDEDSVVNKIVSSAVNEGEFVFIERVTERGEVEKKNEDFWEIGIEVSSLSSFMGAQLKEGERYFLLYTPLNSTERIVLNVVVLSSMVDNTGQRILSRDENVVRTINVLVNSKEELLEISSAKLFSGFELVRAPAGFEWEWSADSFIENFVEEKIESEDGS